MKKISVFLCILVSLNASAVFVNDKGFGEALIVPYYTVNNNLDTLVSVTNTTAQAKALKIHIREGFNGYSVLSYNTYLAAFDTWTFALSRYPSSMDEPSVVLITTDKSCKVNLNSSIQEISLSNVGTGPLDVSRVKEGYIEILEMGEFPPENQFYAAADLGTNGLPADCTVFQEAWEDGGTWSNNQQRDIEPPSGGLMATADLINVGEGINYSIPVTALADFFPDSESFHVSPTDTELSLDAAKAEAVVITDNKHHELTFNSGIDAVSAVLMADKVYSTYVLDSFVAGQTDVVYTQPTRRFYLSVSTGDIPVITAPFNMNVRDVQNCQSDDIPSDFYGGIEINEVVTDREAQEVFPPWLSGGPIPIPPNDAICGSVFVHSFNQPEGVQDSDESAKITGSQNFAVIDSPELPHATENGYMAFEFIDSQPIQGISVDGESHEVYGIPIIGVTLFKFTNAGAAEGLLAQYGGSYPLKYQSRVE